jgi:hypothetical protein
MTEQQNPTLAARLLAVMGEVGYIQKQGKTDSGPKFSYVRHDDVVATLRPALIKHGVAFMAGMRDQTIGCEQVGVTKSGAARYKTTLVLDLTFVNADDPSEAYSVSFPGEGVDTDDKGSGKALSYALKNGLLKMFMIEAGDDADVERSVEPAVDPDELPIGSDAWLTMFGQLEGLGYTVHDVLAEAAQQGYRGEPEGMARGFAKGVFRALRDRAPESPQPDKQTVRDEQAEQAPASPVAAAPEPAATITQTQARALHEMLFAKGRDSKWFLSVLTGKGIGDGEHLTSIPEGEYDGLLDIVRGFEDPALVKPAASATAADFEEAAPAPQEPASEPEAAEADEEPPGMDAEAYKAKRAAQAAAPKSNRKPTVTPPQLTRLGALCADLEKAGVGREEWRQMMSEKEGVISRTDLTKAAATRMIDYLVRWVTDVQSGVEHVGETAA